MTTFRDAGTVIIDNPGNLPNGDTTTWKYSWTTNLPLRKTYADGNSLLMEYGSMNRLRKITNARGQTTENTYDSQTGKLLSIEYSDPHTPNISYTYNHMGWLTEVRDGAGSRTLTYDEYGNVSQESLAINGIAYAHKPGYDDFGRYCSHVILKTGDETELFSSAHFYRTDGRIDGTGIKVNSVFQNFHFGYMPGTHLLKSVTMPGGLTHTTEYDPHRDLESGMSIMNSSGHALISRAYTRDAEGDMTGRTQKRGGEEQEIHSFAYNDRSELTGAQIRGVSYGYEYDNAGNREHETAGDYSILYNSTRLNQYDRIESTESSFTPTYDADGNQTKVQTATGRWNVMYSNDKRPICFTSENGQTVVECYYDNQGRRHTKKVTKNGTVTLDERYLYDGKLRLITLDMRNGGTVLNSLLWNPLAREATRTLATVQNGQTYCCVHDQGKNVTELVDRNGIIAATCDYAPNGAVTAAGTVHCPVQWSNEVYDEELGLVYYNYRHYNPMDGRWISRDPIGEQNDPNVYLFAQNRQLVDHLGLSSSSLFDCYPTDPVILLPEDKERQKKAQDDIDKAKEKAEKEKKEEIEQGKNLPPIAQQKEPPPMITGTGTGGAKKSGSHPWHYKLTTSTTIRLGPNTTATLTTDTNDTKTTSKITGTHTTEGGSKITGTLTNSPTGTTVQTGAEVPIISDNPKGPTATSGITWGPEGISIQGGLNFPIDENTSIFVNGTMPVGGGESPAGGKIGVGITF